MSQPSLRKRIRDAARRRWRHKPGLVPWLRAIPARLTLRPLADSADSKLAMVGRLHWSIGLAVGATPWLWSIADWPCFTRSRSTST